VRLKFASRVDKTMSIVKRFAVWFFFFVVLGLILPGSSAAYLDPGAGSSFIQLALAGLFAISFFLKLGWSRIKSWFARKPPKK